MKVTLIASTSNALDVLIYTKGTRLHMSADGMERVAAMSLEEKMKELAYMKNTIQSSWEFVDFTFAIEGVTRAFTHQLVRHRVGTSFAQQAQRVVEMTDFDYLATGSCSPSIVEGENTTHTSDWEMGDEVDVMHGDLEDIYRDTMHSIARGYKGLLDNGAKPQDARGVLPTNILTNIVFKANLRTLHDMALKR